MSQILFTRRHFAALPAVAAFGATRNLSALPVAFARLEKTNGGRLGVEVIDIATGERAGHRANARFPMCSTFKWLLSAAVLQLADRGKSAMDRSFPIPAKPLLSNSPLTELHAGGTMTAAELCHAALTRSDNTAANLLLDLIGGPSALTAFARSIGDKVTRLDRMELELNECRDGDPRDTTSPMAMAVNLRRILLGSVLEPPSRARLTDWMKANLTGVDRLRAQLPQGWSAADKTGANGAHTSNDLAVFWRPSGAPVIVVAYITQCSGPESKRAAMLAEIGKLTIDATLTKR